MTSNQFSFVQYRDTMKIPDTIYNAKYNGEPAIIRFKEGKPVWVQFCGFFKTVDNETYRSCASIFDPKGIMHSNVELLLPAQQI